MYVYISANNAPFRDAFSKCMENPIGNGASKAKRSNNSAYRICVDFLLRPTYFANFFLQPVAFDTVQGLLSQRGNEGKWHE